MILYWVFRNYKARAVRAICSFPAARRISVNRFGHNNCHTPAASHKRKTENTERAREGKMKRDCIVWTCFCDWAIAKDQGHAPPTIYRNGGFLSLTIRPWWWNFHFSKAHERISKFRQCVWAQLILQFRRFSGTGCYLNDHIEFVVTVQLLPLVWCGWRGRTPR